MVSRLPVRRCAVPSTSSRTAATSSRRIAAFVQGQPRSVLEPLDDQLDVTLAVGRQRSITTDIRTSQHFGKNAYPRAWRRFRQLIERTAGRPFR